MSSPTIDDMCIDAYLPGEHFEPEAMPRPVDPLNASPEELAAAWNKQWEPGQELRIRFLDGSPEDRERVRLHAITWLEYANLSFAFGNHASAEMRITFRGRGYWSNVGTDALQVAHARPTMQFGGLGAGTGEAEFRRVVLHEFGHALGCVHEQASPDSAIPWDEPAVYAFYRSTQGWSDAAIEHNVLKRYGTDEVRAFSAYDPQSIMQYPVPAALTRNGFSVGWNTQLSPGDKDFIARMYPGR